MRSRADANASAGGRLRYNQVAADHDGQRIVVTLSTHAVGRFAERCGRDDGYNGRVRELRHLWEHAVVVAERPPWVGRLHPEGDEPEEDPQLYALIADIVFPLSPSEDTPGTWVATTCLMKIGERGNLRSSASYQRRPARAQKNARRKGRDRVPELAWRGGRFAFEDE